MAALARGIGGGDEDEMGDTLGDSYWVRQLISRHYFVIYHRVVFAVLCCAVHINILIKDTPKV